MTTASGGGEIEISAEMEASAKAASAAGAQIVIEKVEQCLMTLLLIMLACFCFSCMGFECFESDNSLF